MITFHLQVGHMDSANEAQIRSFFESVSTAVSDGCAQWGTQGEVYDAFMAH